MLRRGSVATALVLALFPAGASGWTAPVTIDDQGTVTGLEAAVDGKGRAAVLIEHEGRAYVAGCSARHRCQVAGPLATNSSSTLAVAPSGRTYLLIETEPPADHADGGQADGAVRPAAEPGRRAPAER